MRVTVVNGPARSHSRQRLHHPHFARLQHWIRQQLAIPDWLPVDEHDHLRPQPSLLIEHESAQHRLRLNGVAEIADRNKISDRALSDALIKAAQSDVLQVQDAAKNALRALNQGST